MRKIYLVLVVSLFLSAASINAQTDKKEPPPPPKKETVKFTPPKIVKEEETKFTPPKIVKNGDVKSVQKPEIIVDEKVDASKPQESPVVTVRGTKADEFYKRNPSVAEISRKENVLTLKMKDGRTEKYDMSKKEEDKSFTDKYGRSPIPPPPPKEAIKYKIVDEKVKVPSPPPPPKKKVKA